jgi:predicted ATP-dependent endonuclease of OLD family
MHLTEIGVKNFRVFKDYQHFELAPITVLTGPNSSGKSSLIKLLQLLKDSFQPQFKIPKTRKGVNSLEGFFSLPLILNLENSSGHNLGSFNKFLNENSNSEVLEISLPCIFPDFKKDYTGNLFLSYKRLNDEADVILDEIVFKREKKDFLNLKYEDGNFNIEHVNLHNILDMYFNDELKIREIWKNKSSEKNLSGNNFQNLFQVQETERKLFTKGHKSIDFSFTSSTAAFGTIEIKSLELSNPFSKSDPYFKIPDSINPKEISDEEIELLDKVNELFRDFLKESRSFKNHIRMIGAGSNIKELRRLILDDFTNKLNKTLGNARDNFMIDGASFLLGIKGKKAGSINHENKHSYQATEKCNFLFDIIDRIVFYNFSELNGSIISGLKNIMVKEIKFDKPIYPDENSILYKSLKKMKRLLDGDQTLPNPHLGYFDAILKYFEINEKITIDFTEDYGIVVNLIDENDNKRNINTYGYGYRKLISLAIEIVNIAEENCNFDDDNGDYSYKPSLILVEEPEANLHPNFQSKLADAFLYAAQHFNMQFNIETHSEYLLRKFQYMTATVDELAENDILIHYFPADHTKEKIKKISIKKSGALSQEFGSGFYDEAINLKFELMRIKHNQKN